MNLTHSNKYAKKKAIENGRTQRAKNKKKRGTKKEKEKVFNVYVSSCSPGKRQFYKHVNYLYSR